MKTLKLIITLALTLWTMPVSAEYLGSWKIGALLTFYANTTKFDTGVATDADSVPTYRVYEDETTTPLLTGSMALIDSANTAGYYSEQITLSAANGFEYGKSYSVYVTATVNAVAGATHDNFQVGAATDVQYAGGQSIYSGLISSDAAGRVLSITDLAAGGTVITTTDQYAGGYEIQDYSTAGLFLTSSCITASTTGSPDTVTTREDMSGLTTNGDYIVIASSKACQANPVSEAHCDVSAATSASSFTVATCVDRDGAAITLTTNIFKGGIWRFYTNGSAACNVIDNSILIGAITSGGVITGGSIVPSATPNTSNCGIWHP